MFVTYEVLKLECKQFFIRLRMKKLWTKDSDYADSSIPAG